MSSGKPRRLTKGGLPARFWRKVDKGGEWGCWLWTGAMRRDGYARFVYSGRQWRVHRAVWVHYNGQIAKDHVIDHVCGVRHCVNPAHLSEVTVTQNVLSGTAPAADNARKTHCVHGHEFTRENTRVRYVGGKCWRVCRACEQEYQRNRYQEEGKMMDYWRERYIPTDEE